MPSQKQNFSDSTPAAPAGHTNVTWQADAPGAVGTVRHISAYVPTPATPADYADNESPTGSGMAWTLANAPNPPASLQLFSWISGFGAVLLIQGVDYTLMGNAITITASYTIGTLYAWYRF